MMPFTTKKIKLDGLQSQYNVLSQRYQKLIDQINGTSDSDDKDAQKYRLKSMYEEMDQIERECILLKDEIWKDSATAALKSLYEIVVMINSDIIIEAYHISLVGKFNSDKNTTLEEKLLTLEEIPDSPLPKFVNKIIVDRRLSNEAKREELKNWLKG
jgi:Effector-associated domain 9